jgi:hypothetical protein
VGFRRPRGGLTHRRTGLGLAALAAIALLAYMPSLWSGFVADDFALLELDKRYKGIDWAFSTNTFGEAGGGFFYRPLWVSWNALLHDVFGDSAVALHAVNLVLFAVVAIEVWLLARLVAGPRIAWIAAIVFAVYPRHGETVAWITGSTDLTAAAVALAALLALLAPWPPWVRVLVATTLAAAAALTKEVAFVLPALAFIVLWLRGDRRLRWIAPAAFAAALLVVGIVRYEVIGGFGGYSVYPWRPLRVVFVAVSYVVAAVTPPQLELIRYPALVLFPAAVLAVVVWRFLRVDRARQRVALAGAAWFAVAILPSLNVAVDLNTANGERLLFLPSVGIALVAAALLADIRPAWPLVLVAAGAAALCLGVAWDYVVAGRIADRVVDRAVAYGPEQGQLVLLTVPLTYRNALVFSGGDFDAAVARAGKPGLSTIFCIPVHVRDLARNQVTLRREDGVYRARTTWGAPFDFPVLRSAFPLNVGCSYSRGGPRRWPPGLRTLAVAEPRVPSPPAVYAYFDGDELRRLP